MKDLNSSLQTIGKGAYYTFLGLFLVKLFGYFFKFLTARIGVENFGLLSLGISVYSILTIFVIFGLDYAVIRFIALFKGEDKQGKIKSLLKFVLPLVLILSLSSAILLYFTSDFISNYFFNTPQLSFILKIFAIVIPFESLRAIFLSGIRGFQNIRSEFYIRYLFDGFLKVFLAFLAISLGFGLTGVIYAYLISVIVTFFMSLFSFLKIFSFFKYKSDLILKKEILLYSWPLMFNTLLGLALLSTDSFMLGHFKTAYEVGIYNAVSPIARLTYIFPYSMTVLVVPVVTTLYVQKSNELFEKVYGALSNLVFKLNFPVFVFILIFSKELLIVLFGLEFVQGSLALIILTCGFFIIYFFLVSKEILLVLKKTKLIFLISLFGVIINILLDLLVVKRYGIIGVASASAFSLTVIGILIYYFSYKETKVFIFNLNLIKIFFITIILGFIFRFLFNLFNIVNLLSLSLSWLLFLVLYLVLLFIFRCFNKEDLVMVEILQNFFVKHNFPIVSSLFLRFSSYLRKIYK